MTVIATPSTRKFKTQCTDPSCSVYVTCEEKDFKKMFSSCMGKRSYAGIGVACPMCAQILPREQFQLVE